MHPALLRRRRGGSAVARFAANGSLPKLVVAPTDGLYAANGVPTTQGALLTHTRASTATYVDSTGTLQTAASGVLRDAHHVYEDGQWVNKGIFLESESRTNLFLNSATLSTQGVTTTAQPYTVSFTGTGTITFSGAHTGSLVGTGSGEENRVNVTFTPSAGTVTCTVSGTVSNAQFEAGRTPSSYIPTTGSTATREAETLTIDSSLLPYSATAMSIAMKGTMTYADDDSLVEILKWDGAAGNYIRVRNNTAGAQSGYAQWLQNASGTLDQITTAQNYYTPGVNVDFALASYHTSGSINGAADGTARTVDTTPIALPDLSSADLLIASDFMGTIESLIMWDADIADAGIEEAST